MPSWRLDRDLALDVHPIGAQPLLARLDRAIEHGNAAVGALATTSLDPATNLVMDPPGTSVPAGEG
jgi:hypothetical protein